ncbi:uncharacterized protein MONOS_11166 [Monocercomonoides exilis]|uniref:uncharacterized protein n=1 Tax=Monocercomonoides exilis TaxID=2049356 RepID=UPI0035598618|nr:hypothetical protein MONOS_11166 [Monocercomonoides exilis]|eukprot:MONOS_11166.1-p1 / transcript=MONOS_11166.1 / gene=MONOS_11166 / organism=Monocercomonoides_exilis_PA203 / gene_product=unspecified product / transcript_product=unspecified product / location=Mono_scaffold00545:41540-42038(+) / protein_length=127 / sequence_SO=supercontig / SO=protein_coding / is_pseudo=false
MRLNRPGKCLQIKWVVVKEFVHNASKEWDVNEEEWKARKFVEWEKMHAVRMFACDVVMMNTTALEMSAEVLMQATGSIALQNGSRRMCVAAESEGSCWGESRMEGAGDRLERQDEYVAGCGEGNAA